MLRNLRAFTPILHSSSGRRPSLSSSSSKMQTPKSLRLCVPQKQFVLVHDMYRTHGFVEQRMTRNFRNFHPAHFDSTDHRFAMGGWNGTCVRLLPFSIPPQAVGPMIPSSSLSLYRRRVTPKPLRLCVPTKDSLLLSCLGGTADATLGHDKATKNCSMIHRSDKLYIIYKV